SVIIRGNHQISLNLSDTQFHNLIRIELSLNNSNIGTVQGDISYTNSRIWPNNMQAVILKPETGGLTTDANQVAQLLIDLSKSTWNTSSVLYRIAIRGNALPP